MTVRHDTGERDMSRHDDMSRAGRERDMSPSGRRDMSRHGDTGDDTSGDTGDVATRAVSREAVTLGWFVAAALGAATSAAVLIDHRGPWALAAAAAAVVDLAAATACLAPRTIPRDGR